MPAPADPSKIAVAKYELKKVLHELPDGVHFNIVFFNFTAWCFRYEGMVELNRVTRQQAFDYIDTVGLLYATDIYQAMKKAFEFAGVQGSGTTVDKWNVDTIYFLSDGVPFLRQNEKDAGGIDDGGKILDEIQKWNERPKVTIHTIGIHAEDNQKKAGKKGGKTGRGADFLKQMAEQNGGTYTER